MAVLFSSVPDNYASVFGDLTYEIEGLAAGTAADAEVLTSTSDTPVGAKRMAGGVTAAINAAGYLRRLLAPSPLPAGTFGPAACPQRCITAAVRCGDSLSPVRMFTAATRPLAEYELLGEMPLRRTLAWNERDEIALLLPDGMVSFAWQVSGAAGVYRAQPVSYLAQRGITAFAVDMPSIARTLAGAGAETEGVESLTVRVESADRVLAEVEYTLCRRDDGAVRLCWLNALGGVDFHTFPPPFSESVESERGTFLGSDGYTPSALWRERHTALCSGYVPRRLFGALSWLATSPAVWRAEENGYAAVDILSCTAATRYGYPSALEVTIRDRIPEISQNF